MKTTRTTCAPSSLEPDVRVLLRRRHNEDSNEEKYDQDDHDALYRWGLCGISWPRGYGHNSTDRPPTYRASQPGRRRRHTARNRRGQARLCHLRHIETGGARGNFASAAPCRFGWTTKPIRRRAEDWLCGSLVFASLTALLTS